jgi:antitoxin (DNA-binding transcriptional repressor) of toxin-antitoxin stability system
MIRLNVHEAKTHLSKYLDELANGEVIVLCRRNVPIAEIRGIPKVERKTARPIGLDQGSFEVGPEFFDPLPEDFLATFRGEQE